MVASFWLPLMQELERKLEAARHPSLRPGSGSTGSVEEPLLRYRRPQVQSLAPPVKAQAVAGVHDFGLTSWRSHGWSEETKVTLVDREFDSLWVSFICSRFCLEIGCLYFIWIPVNHLGRKFWLICVCDKNTVNESMHLPLPICTRMRMTPPFLCCPRAEADPCLDHTSQLWAPHWLGRLWQWHCLCSLWNLFCGPLLSWPWGRWLSSQRCGLLGDCGWVSGVGVCIN